MDSDGPHRLIIRYPINQSIKQIQAATKTIYDRPYIIYSSACVFKLHGQCVIDFCCFGLDLRLSLINADYREVTHFRVTLPRRTFVPAQRCALPLPSLRGLKSAAAICTLPPLGIPLIHSIQAGPERVALFRKYNDIVGFQHSASL